MYLVSKTITLALCEFFDNQQWISQGVTTSLNYNIISFPYKAWNCSGAKLAYLFEHIGATATLWVT